MKLTNIQITLLGSTLCISTNYITMSKQVKISGIEIDQIVAIKEQTLPALASTVITAKYKGKVDKNVNYIASTFAP